MDQLGRRTRLCDGAVGLRSLRVTARRRRRLCARAPHPRRGVGIAGERDRLLTRELRRRKGGDIGIGRRDLAEHAGIELFGALEPLNGFALGVVELHGVVGGDMVTGGSPLDPVFWAHHCMVDYCWAKWNMELENNNTNDSTWTDHVNSHFVDADGNPAEFNAAATTLMPLLSYRYETSPIGGFTAATEITSKAEFEKLERRIRAGANIRFDIKKRVRLADRAAVSIARPFSKETRLAPQDFAQIVNADTSKDRIFATIEYASLPAHSDFSVRVFVNLPNASSATSTQDPHFAGSFAFFGSTGHSTGAGAHKPHQPRFLVNLTNTIQRLRESGQLNEGTPLSLQLVPVPFDGNFERPDTQLELNSIEIITTPVIINSPPQ